ncbi:Homocysteine S-methyltransferase [Suillus occidentalis]|nr:Homocysteine S-methyltransferase [Suillus occidentalis]
MNIKRDVNRITSTKNDQNVAAGPNGVDNDDWIIFARFPEVREQASEIGQHKDTGDSIIPLHRSQETRPMHLRLCGAESKIASSHLERLRLRCLMQNSHPVSDGSPGPACFKPGLKACWQDQETKGTKRQCSLIEIDSGLIQVGQEAPCCSDPPQTWRLARPVEKYGPEGVVRWTEHPDGDRWLHLVMTQGLPSSGIAILLSDGGLGTTLEDHFHLPISHTPLWSARIILDAPDTLQQAHLAFLEAGSRVLLTATYQAAYESFERAGYTQERIKLDISSARNTLISVPEDIRIALSLGPFGAVLAPMQDFGGIYPLPYGPRAYSDSEENYDIPSAMILRALTRFHEDRLRVFTSDDETWNKIDFIAFETAPLVREVEAIRRAMNNMKEITRPKPWWITATFPNGKYPETRQPWRGSLYR